ncbi:hypothetical protein [Kitasatospora sp. NPDC008115]|uniref:hypothetical protein n=1 Tax=Kitasatospora sp. NPDC008115 TaxID=3364022 RepID=UPI0036EEC023
MAMTPLIPSTNGVFEVIHRQVTGPLQPNPTHLVVPGADEDDPMLLSPIEAWSRLYGDDRDAALDRAIWQSAIRLAQLESSGAGEPDGGPVSGWQLVLLWLAVPRLRSTVRRLVSQFGLEQAELESTAIVGLLDQLCDTDPAQPEPDSRLASSAVRRCWALVRPAVHERAVTDICRVADTRQPFPDPTEELMWELYITPPDRPTGLAARLRFTASRENVEGLRLGALAERLGLREVVHRARRPRSGPRVSALPLRSEGVRR